MRKTFQSAHTASIKRFGPLLVLLLALPSIHAQEVKHAPTVAQCRADQKVWFNILEDTHGRRDLVTWGELLAWKNEMDQCELVDKEYLWQYYNTECEASAEQDNRYFSFLMRHNLTNQFYTEDAQGKR